jgi:hypothetical protein
MKKKILATFNDLDQAQAAKLILDQAGIPTDVVDESKLQRFVFLSKPLACDKVLVAEADFQKGREVLEAADAQDHILRNEVCCLKCRSPRVQYPQFTRNCLTPTFFQVLFSFLHLTQKKFYCLDCHNTWLATESLRPRTDILNWPSKNRGLVKEERG